MADREPTVSKTEPQAPRTLQDYVDDRTRYIQVEVIMDLVDKIPLPREQVHALVKAAFSKGTEKLNREQAPEITQSLRTPFPTSSLDPEASSASFKNLLHGEKESLD